MEKIKLNHIKVTRPIINDDLLYKSIKGFLKKSVFKLISEKIMPVLILHSKYGNEGTRLNQIRRSIY